MTPAARPLAVVLTVLAAAVPAAAATLPEALSAAAPFPRIVASTAEREPVAPGIERATYRLATADGPLVVSVVAIDLRVPSVRLGAVLADDRIVSPDESVPSMARRTTAVAGINGDYFDIGGTGAPLGTLIAGGALLRAPSSRVALTVGRDRAVRFQTVRFAGAATSGSASVPIAAVNGWPPERGASLLTAAFGAPPPAPGAVVDTLEPLAPAPGGPARFRVAAVADAPPFPPGPALRLGYGAAALALGPVPDVGDVVELAYDTDPPLAGIATAVGGGPLLLRDGVPVDDPLSPNYAERGRRIPAAAAALLPNGTLLLVVVDGRRPSLSIGVDRDQLTALLRGFGSVDAMLFDSGGSATLVARVLGDAAASVVNDPSDGAARPVADGLFAYSDAPYGPPARLIVRPSPIVALAGAHVPVRAFLIDAADHGLGPAGAGPWQLDAPPSLASIGADDVLVAGMRAAAATVRVERDGVAGTLPLHIVERVSRIVIGPARVDPDPGASVTLQALAYDERDRPVAVGDRVRWTARDARIDAERGRLTVGERDAVVTASAGGATATATIPVGRHLVALPPFDDAHRAGWRFATAPPGGSGSLAFDGGELRLGYDFTSGGRAAYADGDVALGAPLALSCAVESDGNGAALRAVLSDRFGDRATITLARALDFGGTRRLSAAVPLSLAPPVALRSLYVVGTLASPPVAVSGAIGVRDCSAAVAGAAPQMPSASQTSPAATSATPEKTSHGEGAAATSSAG